MPIQDGQGSTLGLVNSSNVLQTSFTYDPFGNIKKGGSPTYSAAYQTATNQVSSGISPSPTYDANGNQKNLTATGESISWNALNQPISMNGVTATYDALGRMVETGSGSSPNRARTRASKSGEVAEYVPTAPETAPRIIMR